MSSAPMRCGPKKDGVRQIGHKICSPKCPFWDKCKAETKRSKNKYFDELIKAILKK